MKTLLTPILFIVLLCQADAQTKQTANLILYGKTYTVDGSFSKTSGVVIKDGKILYTGDKQTIAARYTADSIVTLQNATIYPGFIDAHCHFAAYALDAYKCDLVETSSFADVVNRLVAYEQNNKLAWIYGRGWDQNDWSTKQYPTKDTLDILFPNKPVILKRIDGHALLCNQKALDLAGITTKTNIPGGIIEKKDGALTGILIDNATEPVEDLIPMLPKDIATEYLLRAEKECFAEGLTGVVDCGVKTTVINLLQTLYEHNTLSINNSLLLSQDDSTLATFLPSGPFKKGQLQANGIKLYSDGALGSRGACLLQDYSDMPGHKGMLLSSSQKLSEVAGNALQHNWQLCTHAIGDSANRIILDIYGNYLKKRNDKRWRIEHAQVVDANDFAKFGKYSIVPSVQPTHAISDMPWAETRLGAERIHTAYAYNDLLQQNGWIALGTDFPVETISPVATFYTAVVRKDKTGFPLEGYQKENALSRKDALKGMTIWAAKSVFLEKEKGSIEPGKDADLVILDTDLLTADDRDIPKAKVIYTIVKGRIVYKK
ncbi:MAG: amidohydrolase [Flavipsychrobacter sp.]|jgi:predicted amidohydrolase YtcJ|nr:amidohydrolase [Flavipsychrobacter sp.]